MATIRHYAPMPMIADQPPAAVNRGGRPRRPAREKKRCSVTVNFTVAEYRALKTYRDRTLQASDAAAIHAAVITALRATGLLKDAPPEP